MTIPERPIPADEHSGPTADGRSGGDDPSDDLHPHWKYWRTYLARRLAEVVTILRSEWRHFRETYLDESAYLGWVSPNQVPLPERPAARSFPEHLLARSSLEELESAARTMEREGSWYSALELHLEILRRCEASDDEALDVTLYNRIGDIHRLLAVEWYAEAADRYTERELRRGAIALCEKALRLDRDRPEVRRQLELLSGAPAPPAEPVRLPRVPEDAERPEPEQPEPAPPPEPGPEAAEPPEPEPSEPEPPAPTPQAPPRQPAAPSESAPPREPAAAPEPEPEQPEPRSEPGPEAAEPPEPSRRLEVLGLRRPTPPPAFEPGTRAPERTAGEPEPEPQRPPEAAEGRPDAEEEPLPRIIVPPSDEEYERLGRGQVVGACLVLVGVIVAILIWL